MAARGDLERRLATTPPTRCSDEWDLGELVGAMESLYGTGVTEDELQGLDRDAIVQEFVDDALDAYAERENELEQIQEGLMRDLERFIVLQTVDTRWREHLENMDYMREGIGLRGHGAEGPARRVPQRGPHHVPGAERRDPRGGRDAALPRRGHTDDDAAQQQAATERRPVSYEHESLAGRRRDPRGRRLVDGGESPAAARSRRRSQATKVNSEHENVGRNDPCWCGSGKKYKKCHGA